MHGEGLEELWPMSDGLRVLHDDADRAVPRAVRYLYPVAAQILLKNIRTSN